MKHFRSRKWFGFVILFSGIVLAFSTIPKVVRVLFPPQTCPDQPTPVTSGSGHWIKGAPLPSARGETRIGTYNGMIYFIGGLMPNWNASPLVDMYDHSTDTWISRAALPGGTNHPGIASLNGKIYVSGGFNSPDFTFNLKSLWVYDPDANTWASLADMPEVRAAHRMFAINGKLYVVGGGGPTDPTSVWVYDPTTDTWDTSAAHLTSARDHLAGAVVDGKLYIMGGRWQEKGNYSPTQVYDPAADTWTILADIPLPRGGLAADLLSDGKIHVIGGENIDVICTYSQHDVYDPATNVWTREPNLPVARHGLASAAIGNRWYIVGGATSSGPYSNRTLSSEVDIWVPNTETANQ